MQILKLDKIMHKVFFLLILLISCLFSNLKKIDKVISPKIVKADTTRLSNNAIAKSIQGSDEKILSEVIHDDTSGLILLNPEAWYKKYEHSLCEEAFQLGYAYGSDYIGIVDEINVSQFMVVFLEFKKIFNVGVIDTNVINSIKDKYIKVYKIDYTLSGVIIAYMISREKDTNEKEIRTQYVAICEHNGQKIPILDQRIYLMGESVAKEFVIKHKPE